MPRESISHVLLLIEIRFADIASWSQDAQRNQKRLQINLILPVLGTTNIMRENDDGVEELEQWELTRFL